MSHSAPPTEYEGAGKFWRRENFIHSRNQNPRVAIRVLHWDHRHLLCQPPRRSHVEAVARGSPSAQALIGDVKPRHVHHKQSDSYGLESETLLEGQLQDKYCIPSYTTPPPPQSHPKDLEKARSLETWLFWENESDG